MRAVPVQFDPQQKPYLAILIKASSGISRSQLNIFNSEGECVFQELMSKTLGITNVELYKGKESLLIGDSKSGIWIYNIIIHHQKPNIMKK